MTRLQDRGNVAVQESNDVVQEDNSVVLVCQLLRDVIDDLRWKHEAVAAAIGVDGPYFAKMLAGTKSITAQHLHDLPLEIAELLARRNAEAFGFVVIPEVEKKPTVDVDRLVWKILQNIGEMFSMLAELADARAGPGPPLCNTNGRPACHRRTAPIERREE